MKKFLAVLALVGAGLLVPATVASADPSVSECHSVSVVVNGQSVVDNAGCNVLPPQ